MADTVVTQPKSCLSLNKAPNPAAYYNDLTYQGTPPEARTGMPQGQGTYICESSPEDSTALPELRTTLLELCCLIH